jgi:hypothetical protein
MEKYRTKFVVRVPGEEGTLEMYAKVATCLPFPRTSEFLRKAKSFSKKKDFKVDVYDDQNKLHGIMNYKWKLGYESLERIAYFSKWD